MNLIGLIPLMASPTSNLNITVALAICVLIFVQYLNIKNMGWKGFLYHLAGSPTNAIGWAISPLMFPIELLTQISRPITLALRLFGNILGEKILLAFFTMVGITLLYFFPIQIPFMFLGVLTSFMQAMVFTLLTAIYILLSVPHSEKVH
jgi:F-type H+-transporting ATPase subunit a